MSVSRGTSAAVSPACLAGLESRVRRRRRPAAPRRTRTRRWRAMAWRRASCRRRARRRRRRANGRVTILGDRAAFGAAQPSTLRTHPAGGQRRENRFGRSPAQARRALAHGLIRARRRGRLRSRARKCAAPSGAGCAASGRPSADTTRRSGQYEGVQPALERHQGAKYRTGFTPVSGPQSRPVSAPCLGLADSGTPSLRPKPEPAIDLPLYALPSCTRRVGPYTGSVSMDACYRPGPVMPGSGYVARPACWSLCSAHRRPRTVAPERGDLHEGHRADPAAQLPAVPQPRRRRADVADDLRRGAAVGARHQDAHSHRPARRRHAAVVRREEHRHPAASRAIRRSATRRSR